MRLFRIVSICIICGNVEEIQGIFIGRREMENNEKIQTIIIYNQINVVKSLATICTAIWRITQVYL